MSFLVSNFIRPYVSTAKALEIQNSVGGKVYTLGICNYQKSYVDKNKLIIILKDNNIDKQYYLEFNDNSAAIQAQLSFKNAVNTLKLNCEQISLSPPSPSQTPIPITYIEYKTRQQASTLFISQWYDVTDTTNLLGFGNITFRLLAKAVDDYQPTGIIIGTKQLVTITTLDNTIQRFEDGQKKVLALNNSKITYDSACNKLTALSGSNLNAASCSNIEITNGSVAVLSSCSFVTINNNSNVILNNASQVILNGIQQDLTTIGFNLQDVTVDTSDSIGKIGKDTKTNVSNLTLISYKDFTDQELKFLTNNNSIDVILDNNIVSANGEFRIIYTGTGTNNLINIRNTSNALLYQLNDNTKDTWGVFRFNKTTGLFEFINLDFKTNNAHKIYQVNATSNGQVNFTLPVPATDASKLQMSVNGQDQLFGLDFTYSNPGNVIFQNRNFSLNIGDEIKFWIY